ncbi:NAD(P)-dependent dehydrogenase (short-subunit alcohol dehydrogenase family) [Leucobacter exalbidus]|uniref:NAD(P)-dependent dehydrogenase (Short-subunit alcohol dehydrogenase family) n=1 Tax=Leucobacter exalbidus TaxID=662960 RepID=A0A940PLY0_9MICO|nr:NAD(P)-dependent dehydrogenase (short-subunit alcohol dehydrogenase family) [Leucobacter exalbidus]
MGSFDGKVVLISGTGSGMGRAAALAFAAKGAHVVGADINLDNALETQALVAAQGGEIETVGPVDLADPNDVERWVNSALERFGRIDVLYNNAGSVRFGSFDEYSLDDWEYTIRNELTIDFVTSKAVWPTMVSQSSGVIINIASIAAHREGLAFPATAHSAANAGIVALTRTIAAAGAKHGIRAVSISPGWVENPNSRSSRSTDPQVKAMNAHLLSQLPLGRRVSMEEVIDTVMFAASDKASYLTGQDILLDGGMTSAI